MSVVWKWIKEWGNFRSSGKAIVAPGIFSGAALRLLSRGTEKSID